MKKSEILNIKMTGNPIPGGEKVTIGEYLKVIFTLLWNEGEDFSSCMPFGESGWKYEVYYAMIKNKVIDGKIEDGYVEEIDENKADALITELIEKYLWAKT